MKKDLVFNNFKRQWNFLIAGYKTNRLAHSYLLAGPRNVDKKRFVLEFVKYLNCLERKEEEPCLICRNCLQIESNNFIDLKIIEEDLSVRQMKQLKKELIYPPYQAEFRIIIINKTDQIKEDAASVVLKTLEEPNKRNIFFLLADNIFQVLPTIKSRCQVLKFNPSLRQKQIQDQINSDYQKIFLDFKKKSLIEKFSLVKNLKEEEYFPFLEAGIIFFQNKFKKQDFNDYSKEEVITILRNFKKIYFLLQRTNINPRLTLEMLVLNS
jgi:hypothetical protein